MATAFELGIQKYINNLFGYKRSEEAAGQCQNVAVIVTAGQFGSKGVTAQSTANAFYLVGSDANTNTGGAYNNATITFAAGNSLSSSAAENGLITAIGVVCAEILTLETLFG